MIPSNPHRRALAPGLALLAAVAFAPTAAAECPTSVVGYGRPTPSYFAVPDPVYDAILTNVYTTHIAFDRTLGTASLHASSGGRFDANLRVTECFDVIDVMAGTPLDATLRLDLELDARQDCGGSGCGVQLEGTLAVQADSVLTSANLVGLSLTSRTTVTTLTRPIHFVAGTPVPAQFFLNYRTGPGQTDAEGTASIRWSVSGLPAGVRAIASTGLDVTPARRSTWGALKTRYR